jgi:hypothetical protein
MSAGNPEMGKLRELVEKWPHDEISGGFEMRNGIPGSLIAHSASYHPIPHAECRRCQVEALLDAPAPVPMSEVLGMPMVNHKSRLEQVERGAPTPEREPLSKLADEINQCLQIIVTNAGNLPVPSDKLKGSHSFRRERKETIECQKNIEDAVERAKKSTWGALASAQRAGKRSDQTAWLIERQGKDGPEWAIAWGGGFDWTKDSLKAIRFCRREDANQVAEIFKFEDVHILEHIWAAPEPQEGSRGK